MKYRICSKYLQIKITDDRNYLDDKQLIIKEIWSREIFITNFTVHL